MLDSVLDEAKVLLEQLLSAPHVDAEDIPTTQGVYLIYDKDCTVIYVGKGRNLKRRICDDHRGGDALMSTSTFRRSVHKIHGIAPGKQLRDWVRSNCAFAFIQVPDSDLCSAVEALTVRLLRKQGCKLLNA
jgi:hypothetical protein